MTEAPQFDLSKAIGELAKRADTSLVIVSGTILEDWLKGAIISNTRELSAKLKERLFEGYGPLSTFSAKIDIAYAFRIFEKETYDDLRAIKDIRNAFAHTNKTLHFDSPEVAPLFQKLTGWKKDSNPRELLNTRLEACANVLKKHVETGIMIQALKTWGEKHLTSRGKSP